MSEARNVIFSKCTKNYLNSLYVHVHARAIVRFVFMLLKEKYPPFYIYWFLIAHFSGLPLLGSSWKNACSFCPRDLHSCAPLTWDSPCLPSLCLSPALFVWVSCSHSVKETSLLLSVLTCYPFQSRQFQMGRGWGGNLNKEKNWICLGEIYKTSVFCTNSSQMPWDYNMKRWSRALWELLLPATRHPCLLFLPVPSLLFLPSLLERAH